MSAASNSSASQGEGGGAGAPAAVPVTSKKEARCRLDTVFSGSPVRPAACHCGAERRPWYHRRGFCCADVCLPSVTSTPHVSVRGPTPHHPTPPRPWAFSGPSANQKLSLAPVS